MKPVKSESITSDDAEIYYELYGKGEETLVCLHGGPGLGLEPFKPALLRVADERRVLLYDQRGCGRSSRLMPERMCPFELHINDLKTLLRAVGCSKASILGHSFGAYFAALFTLENPELVDRLILISPVTPYQETGQQMHRWFACMDRDMRRKMKRVNLEISDPEKKANRRLDLALPLYFEQKHALEEFRRRGIKVSGLAIEECGKYQQMLDLRPRLGEVSLPVSVACGENDKRTPPEYALEYVDRIPGCNYHAIPECGHFPFMEQPELFNDVLKSILIQGQ